MKKELLKKIELANKEIEKVKNHISKYEDMFTNTYNLKLYEACFYDYSTDYSLVSSDAFYNFCELSYIFFEEWVDENNIILNKIMKYIGRTSSFNFVGNNDFVRIIGKNGNRYYTVDYTETFTAIYEYIMSYNFEYIYADMMDENGYINIDLLNNIRNETEDKIDFDEDLKEVLNSIIEDLYNTYINDIEDTIKVYEYIINFKENQLKYFKGYLEDEQLTLEYEKKETIKDIKKNNEKIDVLINKVKNIITEDEIKLISKLYKKEE